MLYSARIIPFKGTWIEFATDINNVMYAYIDRKKKLPVTTLLRAVGYENDKDILEIFNFAEEVKVNKSQYEKLIGRKLAARVLKTWTEDFVDEDTGEVVSIERNEVVIDRETVTYAEHIDVIFELVSRLFSFIMKKLILLTIQLFSILYRKTQVTLRRKLFTISIVSCVMLILQMTQVHVRFSKTCSSRISVMIWVR